MFKVGDTVRCILSGAPYNLIEGNIYKVTRVENWHVQVENVDRWWGETRFELVSKDEDLPEVPEEVTHYYNNQFIAVYRHPDSTKSPYVLMRTKNIKNLRGGYFAMSPDEALALAHDIMRQAMQVKRNIKENKTEG